MAKVLNCQSELLAKTFCVLWIVGFDADIPGIPANVNVCILNHTRFDVHLFWLHIELGYVRLCCEICTLNKCQLCKNVNRIMLGTQEK